MQTTINEIGRSMVEMLGVLAVIGVLSVSGILGYKFAMNKYIANETVNELVIRANDIAYQMDKLIEANHVGKIEMELGNTTRMGYPIMAQMNPLYVDYFEIFLSDVPSEICRLLLQSQWQSPYSIFIGIEEFDANVSICNTAEKVGLIYEFYKDLSAKNHLPENEQKEILRCYNDYDCKCGYCQNGLCISTCGTNETCSKNFEAIQELMCCDKKNIVNGMCCAYVSETGECCTYEGVCCPKNKPMITTGGQCVSCEDSNRYPTSQTECQKCSNRTHGFAYDYCSLTCGLKGSIMEDKPLYENRYGACFGCYETGAVWMGEDIDKCATLCPNRLVAGQNCVYNECDATAPLISANGECVACDSTVSIPAQDACETKCDNRKNEGNYCIVKDCPANNFRTQTGQCIDCSSETKYPTTEEECQKCSNRTHGFAYDYCSLTCGLKGSIMEDKPLYENRYGACFGCYEVGAVWLGGDIEKCTTLCSNRIVAGQNCVYNECDATAPLISANGECVACDSTVSIPAQDACETKCDNRKNEGNYCVLTCKDGEFLTENGICLSCTDAGNYRTMAYSEAECQKCSDRIYGWIWNTCMLKCGMPNTYTADKLLPNYHGTCYSCDVPDVIPMYPNATECSTICPNRQADGGNCVRMHCSDENRLEDSSGNCHPCNTSVAVDVGGDTTKCAKCLGRKISGNLCVLI